LKQLCRRRPLLGNSPEIVATVKNPKSFTKLLDTLGIPYPEIRYTAPRRAENWLTKSNGGSGGGHVRWSCDERSSNSETHYQRYVHGRSLSATVLASGSEARVIGYCEQWCDSTSPARPFTYGGAVTLDERSLSRSVVGAVQEAGRAIVNATGMRGLCSVDFVADENNWWLIESNPRPGATFELHEQGVSLFKCHVEAMYGQLNDRARVRCTAQRGYAIVYAPRRLTVLPDWEWPSWVTDRPRVGTVIDEGEPVCSVHAEGASSAVARTEIEQRRCALMTCLERW
jgi:predicted ATP-grasp superfamily ATP-dependent carboligase